MTRLANDPRDFAKESSEGFVAAFPSYVRAVDGGVVRASAPSDGTVAVVIGGGSGHYPAFAGLVGPGLATGAAMGNIFASPAAGHVVSVARAAERGGGVLLTYGNYAGDVLNFDEAQQQLRGEGMRCETVVVTDDISSAPADTPHLRRGIAGDLVVFKCAGAAAELGYSMDDVVRVARLANDRTRTIGAAFSGCSLPGADEPLFTVPAGRMALGMGIHGEPGIAEMDMPSADGLAEVLVGHLLAEVPPGASGAAGGRVIPIFNGLGTVKYEEMFVVYRRIAGLLTDRGLTVLDPQVGEFCTSFDMSGVSLTLFWPDDELVTLWTAPADAPAFRRLPSGPVGASGPIASEAAVTEVAAGSPESQQLGKRIVELIRVAAKAVDTGCDEFGRLDAVAGDGDHGIGMKRGVEAALAAAAMAASGGAGAGTVLGRSGEAWALEAGGTSGALWGGAIRAMGEMVGDRAVPDRRSLGDIVAGALRRVQERGGAVVGDKTMVDAFVPFAEVLAHDLSEGATVADATATAARAAAAAAAATAGLLPRLGRARPHAERSLGTPDPGAYSFAVIVTAVGDALAKTTSRGGV
jgi:D-erythrulose 4-kinase